MKLCLVCGRAFQDISWSCPGCSREPPRVEGYLSFSPDASKSSDGFPADEHDRLFELEAQHFWFRARNRLILWALAKYFPAATNLLEIGCGNGFVLSGIRAQHPEMELSGSEIRARALQFAAKRVPDAVLYQIDATKIPFQDHFDVIGAFDVLEHIEDDRRVLKEMYMAVRRNQGGIIVSVPQHRFLWSTIDEFACHRRRYSAKDLRAKVEQAGFRVVRTTSFVSLLLPLMIAARLKKRKQSLETFDPTSEFRLPKVINKSLEWVLNLEGAAVAAGMSWPVGGSLLLVARAD